MTNTDTLEAKGVYHIVCKNADGNVVWEETAPNTVSFQGKNSMLDNYLSGTAYTGTFYMSLVTSGTATTASTYAVPIVTEIGAGIVTSNLRPAVSWSASASGSKSASTTTFTITGSATITGNMLVSGGSGVTTVGNTAATNGVLFSAAAFSGGSKSVASGDSLSVTYSISV